MFLGHRVDITKALESSESSNVLEIEFDCAQIKARELRDNDKNHKWNGFNGDMSRLAVRKAQYHWGWDWGPVIMTAGIWREVRLEVYSARVEDLWPQTNLASDHKSATVTAVAKIDASKPEGLKARFYLTLDGRVVSSQDISVGADKTAQATFKVETPELWWPHGYGSQTLYEVSVSLLSADESELHQLSKKFGIRTAEVVQQLDKHGKSFFFRVNGVDIFCGGSCWIPADSLLPSVTTERYWNWIKLMVAGGQIMVR